MLKSTSRLQIWLSFWSLFLNTDKEDSLGFKGLLELVEEKEILLAINSEKKLFSNVIDRSIFCIYSIGNMRKTSKRVAVFFCKVGVIKRFPRSILRSFDNKRITINIKKIHLTSIKKAFLKFYF